MKDYRTELWIAAAMLVVVLALIAVLVFNRGVHRAEVEALRATITELSAQPSHVEEPSGGMETDAPEVAVSEARFRFPIAPEDYRQLTSPYGYRVSPILRVERYHAGIDIAAAWRAQVVAVADGVVVEHWPPPGTPYPNGGAFRGHRVYGGMILVEHDDGWRSLYAHLSWSRVTTGQRVRSGEVIGRVGGTGMVDGEHLHFELHDADGVTVNPLLYVDIET